MIWQYVIPGSELDEMISFSFDEGTVVDAYYDGDEH